MTLHHFLKCYRRRVESNTSEDGRLTLLRHLADPVRLKVLDRLLEEGPASVSELAARLDVSVPALSNQLRRLREGGLVEVERVGRQGLYRVAGTHVGPLLRLLAELVGGADEEPSAPPPFVLARTCYDHLAGRLGVDLFERLVQLQALRSLDGEVEPGPRAEAVLSRLGVVIKDVPAARRSLASTCPDATEGRPHLGGTLGAALGTALEDRGWTRSREDRRDVEVTPAGRRGLRRSIQLDTGFLVGR
jgi:DNA-binding transcriptional ArsR family regulator